IKRRYSSLSREAERSMRSHAYFGFTAQAVNTEFYKTLFSTVIVFRQQSVFLFRALRSYISPQIVMQSITSGKDFLGDDRRSGTKGITVLAVCARQKGSKRIEENEAESPCVYPRRPARRHFLSTRFDGSRSPSKDEGRRVIANFFRPCDVRHGGGRS